MEAATQSDKALQRRFESVQNHARKTWEVMRGNVHPKTLKVTTTHGEGYFIHGSVAGHIRQVSKDTTGHDADKNRVGEVRNYLRYSHNVVVHEPTQDKFVFKIFVRDEWNSYDAILPLVFGLAKDQTQNKNWYERKVTPEEAGEMRAPAEVRTEWQCPHCEGRFASQQHMAAHVSHHHKDKPSRAAERSARKARTYKNAFPMGPGSIQEKILRIVVDRGRIESPNGRVATIIAKELDVPTTSVSGALKRLIDKNFINRDKHSPKAKRTYMVEATHAGYKAVGAKPKIDKPISEPDKPKVTKEEPAESPTRTRRNLSDKDLLAEITGRLQERDEKIRELESQKADTDLKDKIDLVASLVNDFENGESTALKTIADISEAITI